MTRVALDTSVAVPLLSASQEAHAVVDSWCAERSPLLCGHAIVETYSVLTRLPGDARLRPQDAARLLRSRFGLSPALTDDLAVGAPARLADAGISGGGAYDALVAWAALALGLPLATRDARARPTYEAVGVRTLVVG